jgi:Glucosamine-6-phosphate isomerases/6-phosphogluconolactonase
MKIDVLPDPDTVAREAAKSIAAEARAAVLARGRLLFAVSGGHTPWLILRALAGEPVPWAQMHLVQVDERVAPSGDPDRNFTHIRESLLTRVLLRAEHAHAMPVEGPDLEAPAESYARLLQELPAPRWSSTSFTSAWGLTATPLPWSPATRCWTFRRRCRADRGLPGHLDVPCHKPDSAHPLAGDRG